MRKNPQKVVAEPPAASRSSRDSVGCELIVEALFRTGRAQIRAVGTSMRPALRPGDILKIERPAGIPEIGTIVVALRDGGLVAHRVVERIGSGDVPTLVTRGDALGNCDSPLSADEVLGKVVSVVRAGRTFAVPDRGIGPSALDFRLRGRHCIGKFKDLFLKLRLLSVVPR